MKDRIKCNINLSLLKYRRIIVLQYRRNTYLYLIVHFLENPDLQRPTQADVLLIRQVAGDLYILLEHLPNCRLLVRSMKINIIDIQMIIYKYKLQWIKLLWSFWFGSKWLTWMASTIWGQLPFHLTVREDFSLGCLVCEIIDVLLLDDVILS